MKSPLTSPLRTLALLACACMAGCASPPPAPPPSSAGRTTVVLLADEDGHVGAVSVSTAAGSQSLDRAYSAATADASTAPPSMARDLGRERVNASYAGLLKAQPSKPVTFTLNFLLDRTVLTDESKSLLPVVLETMRARKPTEITVFGHADASGTEERNFKLSAERAKFVADLLRQHDPTLDKIDVQSFGDKVPLVPSDTRAAEPRNRRAEIVIL